MWNQSPFATASAQTYLDGIEASASPFELLVSTLTQKQDVLAQSMAACESMYAAIGVVAAYSGLPVVADKSVEVHLLPMSEKQWHKLQDLALQSLKVLGGTRVASYLAAADEFEDEAYLETMQSAHYSLSAAIAPV